jgi:hypothetical protein
VEAAMADKRDLSLDEALAGESSAQARTVLNYTRVMKRLLDAAKTDPAFTAANWAPLAEFVDVNNFERVGAFKEVVRWAEYAHLLTEWAKRAQWDVRVRRITERDNVVFLELAEFARYGDLGEAIFSMSVYEFDAAQKLRHLDIYMQREPTPVPDGAWDLAEGR